MKKIIAMVLSVVMVLGLCMTAMAASTNLLNMKQDLEWKKDVSPIKFTAFMDVNPNEFAGWGNDPISKEITKRTGVTIDVTAATTTDHTQLQAMIASNELPDFVLYEPLNSAASVMIKQGFLQPLNKLWAKYAPKMKTVLPQNMDSFWAAEDGNLYNIPSYFSDKRIDAVKGNMLTHGAFVINRTLWKKIGSPKMNTPAEYKAALLKAKKLLKVKFPLFNERLDFPRDSTNIVNVFYRTFGGAPTGDKNAIIVNKETGAARLNFTEPAYKKAILYLNDLYRSGLFNAEMFTSQKIEQYQQLQKSNKIFSAAGNAFDLCKVDLSNAGAYKPTVDPVIEKGAKFTLPAGYGGGWYGPGISTNCKNSARAIKYLEFIMSDEGAMLTYHGVEGKDYTMVDGYPKNSKAKDEAWKNFGKMQKDMGILNYYLAWGTPSFIDALYYFHLNKGKEAYTLEAESNRFAVDATIENQTVLAGDAREKITETKIEDLWKTSLPKMILAKSKKESEAAYNTFVAKAKKLGLAKLEVAYSAVGNKWVNKLTK